MPLPLIITQINWALIILNNKCYKQKINLRRPVSQKSETYQLL